LTRLSEVISCRILYMGIHGSELVQFLYGLQRDKLSVSGAVEAMMLRWTPEACLVTFLEMLYTCQLVDC